MKPRRDQQAPTHVVGLNPCPADTPQAALERLLGQARGYSSDWPPRALQELQHLLDVANTAMTFLPTPQAYVLHYRYIEGYSERDTAVRLKMSVATVRHHLHRACLFVAPILTILPTPDDLLPWSYRPIRKETP